MNEIIEDAQNIKLMTEEFNITLKNEKFELFELLNEVVAHFFYSFKTTLFKFLCQIDSKLIKNFIGDAAKIKEIITNIIYNILKYKHSGKVEINVFEKTRNGNITTIVISISDFGVPAGKNDGHLCETFDDYCMAEEKDCRMRFVMVKKLVEAMNGGVYVSHKHHRKREFLIEISLLSAGDE